VSEQDRPGCEAPTGHPSTTEDDRRLGSESVGLEQSGEPACWAPGMPRVRGGDQWGPSQWLRLGRSGNRDSL